MQNQEELTLRDRFAMAAMSQLLTEMMPPDEVARQCYELADAMLEARKPKVVPVPKRIEVISCGRRMYLRGSWQAYVVCYPGPACGIDSIQYVFNWDNPSVICKETAANQATDKALQQWQQDWKEAQNASA